jgi:hypothetical protein
MTDEPGDTSEDTKEPQLETETLSDLTVPAEVMEEIKGGDGTGWQCTGGGSPSTVDTSCRICGGTAACGGGQIARRAR